MACLQVTTQVPCSIACAYCPQDSLAHTYAKRNGNASMSMEDFRRHLRTVPREVEVWFAGMCEPWLNQDCTDMLLHAHSNGHLVCVFTTLTGLTLSDIDRIESVSFGFFRAHVPSDPKREGIRVTGDYLALLDRIAGSRIMATYHTHGRAPDAGVKEVLDAHNKTIEWVHTLERAGNLRLKGRPRLPRRRGTLRCARNLRNNVLLPNGDVILCSNDYGMKHVLGNFDPSSYESLFTGKEFTFVKEGQQDASLDTLCRYCQDFCGNGDVFAKFCNLPYRLNKQLLELRIH